MSNEWIKAQVAADAMWPGRKPAPVPNAITRRAEKGMVKANAELLSKQGPEGTTKVHNCPIPEEFWGGWAMIPNWESGDFSAQVRQNGREEEWSAFGVTFERSGIEAMAQNGGTGTTLSQSKVSEIRPKGGNPGKYDWAKAVGAVIFQWVDSASWQPTSQGEVKAKLADWFLQQNQTPDDKQLKDYARWLFVEFKKHNSKVE